jgi:hypothetical protein
MDLKLDLNDTIVKLLQKEAAEKKISVSQLVSDLLKNYISNKTFEKKQTNAQKLLKKLAAESPELPMPEEEMMDLINSEIKAYREEKRQVIENQIKS